MVRKILIINILSLMLFAHLGSVATQAAAAEVRGTVTVEYQGMFKADTNAQSQPVSVALFPAQGQRVVKRPPRLHRVEIIGNRMSPAFFTVKTGDSIRFANLDGVYHEIFSLSSAEPWSSRIDRSGDSHDVSPALKLDTSGTTHFFCRIHSKSYARIDVVDTPYLETVQSGRPFRFPGLRGGKWKLRMAAPAAETRMVDVSAITAPPPLALRLVSHGGGQGSGKLATQGGVEQLYRE